MSHTVPAHLRVPWGAKQALVVFLLPWVLVPLLIFVTLVILAPYVPAAAVALAALDEGTLEANFALVLIDAIAQLGIAYYYLKRYQLSWGAIGWRRFNVLRAIGLVGLMFIIFSISIYALMILISFLIPGFDANQAQTNEFTESVATNPNLVLVALVIFPPIIEELIFRGFIFPALSQRRGVVFGAVMSSALFGLAHLQPNVAIYTFLIGLVLCFMYVRLKSIVPGILLHMVNNYLAYIALAST